MTTEKWKKWFKFLFQMSTAELFGLEIRNEMKPNKKEK